MRFVFVVLRRTLGIMTVTRADAAAVTHGEGFLTTGEAARLLGVSRQQVVNMCNAGDLPHAVVGTHRRIRRVDVEDVLASRERMTADQVRSLLIAHAVAGKIVTDLDGSLALARTNLQRMITDGRLRGGARIWLSEWDRLLNGPVPELLGTLTSPSRHARELRQVSPFAGLLDDAERQRILSVARQASRPARHRRTGARV